MTEKGAQETDGNSGQEAVQKASERIEPILAHLKVVETDVDLDKIRTHFDQLWDFETGNELSPEEQRRTIPDHRRVIYIYRSLCAG
jgi:plasmid stabilization system protein ParE